MQVIVKQQKSGPYNLKNAYSRWLIQIGGGLIKTWLTAIADNRVSY